jgi:hypothetical protein
MWGPQTIDERFDARDLDPAVWTGAYLPAWSSLTEAAATYRLDGEGLHLRIPPEHPLWCPDLHDPPLKVSAVQSGNWSGPIGSTRGQQPFRDGLVVREKQPTRWGFTPHFGHIAVECRAEIGPRSMFSAWMVGLEDQPERCGEICIIEVFGDSVSRDDAGRPTAALGTGVHRFRDPALREEFSAERAIIDIRAFHSYAVTWRPGALTFFVDGSPIKTLAQAPDYPMQLILAVFDFPERDPTETHIPDLVVQSVTERQLQDR